MIEYQEDDFLMLSGIQHFAFCRRQWALIDMEQQWEENVYTAEGRLMHKRAHDVNLIEKTKDVLIVRALPIHSRKLGISGECDVVEFKKSEEGVKLYGHRGYYEVYPIEYKRGKPKTNESDTLQLTAQVMCLEEMFCTTIEEGALFYGETKRREKVQITQKLREKVCEIVTEMHQLYQRGHTPKVKWSKSCNACSLKESCVPKLGKTSKVAQYIDKMLSED